MRWVVLPDGVVDCSTRPICGQDRPVVLPVRRVCQCPCLMVFFWHPDGTFSQHVDEFYCELDAFYTVWIAQSEGFIEMAVWFDATEHWSPMVGGLKEMFSQVDLMKESLGVDTSYPPAPP